MREDDVRPLAPEAVVELRDAGGLIVRWFCTPEHLDELTAGWLVGEGRARSAEDIGPLVVDGAGQAVRLTGPRTDPRAPVRPLPEGPPRMADSDAFARRDTLRSWFEAMFERGAIRERSGGVHTGALVRDGELVAVREDVSRHCVVDKLIGGAVLDGAPLDGVVLLLTGRLSGAIAAKGARAGLAAMATLSIPTTLAAEIAGAAGLTLIGRARSAVPHLYAPRSTGG